MEMCREAERRLAVKIPGCLVPWPCRTEAGTQGALQNCDIKIPQNYSSSKYVQAAIPRFALRRHGPRLDS